MAKKPGRNALLFIFISITVNMTGFGVIMPVMPQLIMDITGEDITHAARWGGYLSFVYAAMQFVMMPVMGGLSDRFGRRPVLLVSMAAYSADFLVMALAPFIGLIVVARVLSGAFAATFSTANAYIADISAPEKRAANFGLAGAAFGIGFIIGPAIGGFLGEHYGPRAPFFFVSAIGALNFLYGYFILPETLKTENRRPFEWKRANAFGNLKQFSKYPVVLPIAGVFLLIQLAHWTYPSVWAYYAAEKFSWTPGMVGTSLMFVGLTSAIVQAGLVRIVIPVLGERATASLGMTVTALSYMAFALADTGAMVYLVIAVSALGGVTQPALQGILSRTIPDNAQGELQGAVATVTSLTMAAGPLFMTQVFSLFSSPGEPFSAGNIVLLPEGVPFYFPGMPFAVAAFLELCALALLVYAFRYARAGKGKPG